ncbi:MAG: hypothetical protein M1836_001009 [Candelina mexicana]|nr:MAG: hypothetical protein M1836_001009 [Candelina mexicana]
MPASFLSPLRLLSSLALGAAVARAQQLQEGLSFGHAQKLSPHGRAIPGWHIQGSPDPPQLLSDRVILTPPYPGGRRGAIWTEERLLSEEWTADFEFRASGPERGGGNLQIWYTRDGQAQIGTSSIYTIGKFEGMVLVIDTYGGRHDDEDKLNYGTSMLQGGGIRGFLNDGSTEYRSQHNVDSLAFGHCDYAYRNLGRPSHIQLKQTRDYFQVEVDSRPCFKSDKIILPQNYYFGVSAASAETPDSFEAYKFLITTPSAPTRHQPPPIPPHQPAQHQQNQHYQQNPPADRYASQITSHEAQFADLHDRLQYLSHQIDSTSNEISSISSRLEERHQESLHKYPSQELSSMDSRLNHIENIVRSIQKDVEGRDYKEHLTDLKNTLSDTHRSLLTTLPKSMGDGMFTPLPSIISYPVPTKKRRKREKYVD